jgi:hypothetical protein
MALKQLALAYLLDKGLLRIDPADQNHFPSLQIPSSTDVLKDLTDCQPSSYFPTPLLSLAYKHFICMTTLDSWITYYESISNIPFDFMHYFLMLSMASTEWFELVVLKSGDDIFLVNMEDALRDAYYLVKSMLNLPETHSDLIFMRRKKYAPSKRPPFFKHLYSQRVKTIYLLWAVLFIPLSLWSTSQITLEFSDFLMSMHDDDNWLSWLSRHYELIEGSLKYLGLALVDVLLELNSDAQFSFQVIHFYTILVRNSSKNLMHLRFQTVSLAALPIKLDPLPTQFGTTIFKVTPESHESKTFWLVASISSRKQVIFVRRSCRNFMDKDDWLLFCDPKADIMLSVIFEANPSMSLQAPLNIRTNLL